MTAYYVVVKSNQESDNNFETPEITSNQTSDEAQQQLEEFRIQLNRINEQNNELREIVKDLNNQISGQGTYIKPVDDKYWWIGDSIVHLVFMLTLVMFVLIRVEVTQPFATHWATAVVSGVVGFTATVIL